MHITLISTSYPVGGDGSEAAGSFVEDFSRALARHVSVTVVAPALAPARVRVAERLEVVYFRAPRLPLSLLNPLDPARWPAIVTTLRAGSQAVHAAVRDNASVHTLALWALPSGYWALEAGRRCGTPFSTWSLGSDVWSLGRIPLIKGLLRRVLRRAQHRFADGLGLAREVEALAARPCAFLPSSRDLGVRTAPPRPAQPPFRVAFLGRWHRNKGVDLLLGALEVLDPDSWSRIARFDIAGGGPLAAMVRERAHALQTAGRPVAVQGFLDRDAARAYLEKADFVVIPSRIESIPVIFSDCLQAGCSIVSTPVGDLPELVGRLEVGELCAGATAEAVAQGLGRALINGPAAPIRLREAAGSFSVRAAASAFLETIGWTARDAAREGGAEPALEPGPLSSAPSAPPR